MIDCDTTSWKASFQAFGSSTYVCYNIRSLSHCGRSRGPNRVVIVKCIVSVLKYDISTYAWYNTFQKNIQSDIELKLTNLFLCWNSRNKKYAVSIRFLIYKIIPNLIISEIIHVKNESDCRKANQEHECSVYFSSTRFYVEKDSVLFQCVDVRIRFDLYLL